MRIDYSAKNITRISAAVCLVLILYLLGKLYWGAKEPVVPDVDLRNKAEDVFSSSPLPSGENPSSDEDIFIFGQRDVFAVPYAKDPEPVSRAGGEAVTATAGSLSDFRLIGVVLDQNPQAIVEDVKKQQTVFVSAGESLGPGVVKDVQENKILLNVDNNEMELIIEDGEK